MKNEPDIYKPAEACRIAEVAPYVLRYWETEFPSLSDGKEKGAARLYTGRDVKVIRRIRELLYDEGFTVAGAKKRLEAEIAEGRFDDDLEMAPPPAAQKKTPAASAPSAAVAESPTADFLLDVPAVTRKTASAQTVAAASAPAPTAATPAARTAADFPDKKRVVRELKEIVKILDRGARKTR
jgi:DNA-binding transcriptional MerR regulator